MLANRLNAARRFEQLEDRRMLASFPLPMTPILPLSAGVYETATTGFLAAADAVENLPISLHRNQFVHAIVVPTFGPQNARVEFADAEGEILATGELFGSDTAIRVGPVRITESGEFSFSIDSPTGDTGAFSIRIVTNAFFEEERFGGEANDSIDTATPLIPVWEPVAGTYVSTVLGTQPSASANTPIGRDWYKFTLEDGETSSMTLTAQSIGLNAPALTILRQDGQPIDSGEIDSNGNLSIPVFTDNTRDGQRDDYYVLVSGDALDYSLSVVTNGVFGLGQRVVDASVVLGEKSADFSMHVAGGQPLTIQTHTLQLGDSSVIDDTDLRIEALDQFGQKVAVEENSADDGRNARMTATATHRPFRRFRVTSFRQSIQQQRSHRTVASIQRSGQATTPVLRFTLPDGGSELITNEPISSLELLANDRLRRDVPIARDSVRLNGDPVRSIRVENTGNSSRVLVTFDALSPGRHIFELAPGSFTTMNGMTNEADLSVVEVDDEPPTLVRSTLAKGDILQTGRQSIELEFSEPIQGPTPWNDVRVPGIDGAIIDPHYDHSTNTLKFDLDLPEDQYQLVIGASDLAGNSIIGDRGDAEHLIIDFQFDTSTEELHPVIVAETSPFLKATTTGQLQTSEDHDVFSIDLLQDQPITFRALSESEFDVRLRLFDPNNVLVFDSMVGEPNVPFYRVIEAGRHSFVVSPADRQLVDSYQLEVLINGRSELELEDQSTNDSLEAAEDIDDTFDELPLGNRFTSTTVGAAQLDHSDWYSFTLKDAEFLTLAIDTRFHHFALRDAEGKLITWFLPGFIPSARYETTFRDITNNGVPDRYFVEIYGYSPRVSEYALHLAKGTNPYAGREFYSALHVSSRSRAFFVPVANGETVQIDVATIPIGDEPFLVDFEIGNATNREVIAHQLEEGIESFRYRGNDYDSLRMSLGRVSGEGWLHLRVSGEDLSSQPFSIGSITPRADARITDNPEFLTIVAGESLNLSTVDPADLTVNGLPAVGVEISKLSHLRFEIDPASLDDTSVIHVNLPAGVLTTLGGRTNEAFTSTYVIDNVGPSLLSSSITGEDVVPPGPLKIMVDFGSDLDGRSLNDEAFELISSTLEVIVPDDTRFDSETKKVILEFSDLREGNYTLRTREFEDEEPSPLRDLAGNILRDAANIAFTVDRSDVVAGAETLEFKQVMPAGSLASKVTLNANLHAATDRDVFAIPLLDDSFFELVISPNADDASLAVEVDGRTFRGGPGEPIYVPSVRSGAAEPVYIHVQSDLAVDYTMDAVQNAMELPTDRGGEVVDISQSAINIDNGTRYAAVGSAVPSTTTTESAGPDQLFLQNDWQISRLTTSSLSADQTFRLSNFDVSFDDRNLTLVAFDGQFIWTERRRTLRKHDLSGNVLSEASIPDLRIRSFAVDTRHVYTLATSPPEISVFDKETLELTSSLQYGYEIRDLASVDVDEIALFVGSEVHFVRIDDGKITRVLPLPDRFREADHIAVVDNKLYVLTKRETLAEFTLDGVLLREIPAPDARNLFGSNFRFTGDVDAFSVPTEGVQTASVIVQADAMNLDSLGSVRILDSDGNELAPTEIQYTNDGHYEAFFDDVSGTTSLTVETTWTFGTDYIVLVTTDAILDSSVGSSLDNVEIAVGLPVQRILLPDSPTFWGVNDFELTQFSPAIDANVNRFLLDESAVGNDALAFDGRYLYIKTATGLQQVSPTNGKIIQTFPWADITRHGFVPNSIDFAFGEIYLAFNGHVDVFDPRSGLRRASKYEASSSIAFDSVRGVLYQVGAEGIIARNIATSDESLFYRHGRSEEIVSLTVIGEVLYASFERGFIESFSLPSGRRQRINRSDRVRFNGLAGDTFRSFSDERQPHSQPTLSLDRKSYRVFDSIQVTLMDIDLTGSGTTQATVESSSDDAEVVELGETRPGVFVGTIRTQIDASLPEDGVLSMSAGDSIVAQYDSGRPNDSPLNNSAWVAPIDHHGAAIFREDINAGEQLLVSISNLSAIVDTNANTAVAVVADRFGNTLGGVRVAAGTEQFVVPIETSGVYTVHVHAELGEVQVSTRVQTIFDRTDLNGDGTVGIEDVDIVCRSIANGEFNDDGDLNHDGNVDSRDLDLLVRDLLRSSAGDTNLDGRFDSSDLVSVFQNGEYEDSIPNNSAWSTGDWDCNGEFTTSDLVRVFRESPYQRNAAARRSDIAAAIHGARDTETQDKPS